MALSLIDRLMGRTESAAPIEAKAAIGAGVASLMYGTPLHTWSRDPNRLMAEAQALFHTNGWVGAAERALGGRFIRMAWHLEDENGKTVDDKSPEAYQQPLKLLQRPSKDKTRREVMSVTFRHEGLCGNGIWYLDERDMLADTPLSLMYINPVRMTPALDSGGNVMGWILDHPDNPMVHGDHRPGIPLKAEEVIHFTLDPPDWGHWGVGIAEAAQRKIELDRLADSHAGGVLSSGGRLSGLVSPKATSSVTDDQWVQFVRDWRSITSDPDAAKRLQIAKMPLDFTQMTASPKDLQLNDVVKQTKEDILAQWGVPLSQLGINVTAGLNSDRSQADDAAIWETIKHRAEAIRETIQVRLLDRWEVLGVKVTLVFDYPEFDDRTPQYEAVAKAVNAPITNDERRDILGLEPLEDKTLGRQIWIHSSLVRIDAEPEADPEAVGPETPSPENISLAEPTEEEADVIEAKADIRKPLLGLRSRTEMTWTPKFQRAVQAVLTEQRHFIGSKLAHIVAKPTDVTWWNDKRERQRFMVALAPLLDEMAADVAAGTARLAKKPGKADSMDDILAYVRAEVGKRITGINQTTRDKVQQLVAEGIEQGMGPAELGARLRESAAFDEARAEMIARTETAYAYNDSAIQSYRALDVEEVQVIDGDADDICAPVNGATWTMDEALSNPIGHPNCTRDFIPVVKAVVEPNPLLILAEAMKANMERPPAVINVTTPDVHVTTPPVNVTVPEQPAPQVNVTIPPAKATTKRIIRDADGAISGLEEIE